MAGGAPRDAALFPITQDRAQGGGPNIGKPPVLVLDILPSRGALGSRAVQAEKAQMENTARDEVLVFKNQSRIGGGTGEQILKELLAHRSAGNGKGAGRLCTWTWQSARRAATS